MKLTPDQIIARHGLLVQADTAPLLARIASLEAEIQALRAQVKAGIKRELEYRERITELRDDATNTLRALTTPTSSTETEKL